MSVSSLGDTATLRSLKTIKIIFLFDQFNKTGSCFHTRALPWSHQNGHTFSVSSLGDTATLKSLKTSKIIFLFEQFNKTGSCFHTRALRWSHQNGHTFSVSSLGDTATLKSLETKTRRSKVLFPAREHSAGERTFR